MPNSPPTIIQRCLRIPHALLFDPRYFWALATLVIVGDTLLTVLVIQYVPCQSGFNIGHPQILLNGLVTEIDWETYMTHIKVFHAGERNYSRITGPTGPLVYVPKATFLMILQLFSVRYPAGHVRLHELLYEITDAGRDVHLAQYIYGVLYLTTLTLTSALYRAAGNVPNWIILLLPLSKRLHSIFVLRLFNDCWAVAAVQLAILLFQKGFYDSGMMFFRCVTFFRVFIVSWIPHFSAALSIKMSILLYLPGLLVIVFLGQGLKSTLDKLMILLATQVIFAMPFLQEDAWAYLHSAFDLGRVFLYKWTVNWRLLDEGTFLSKQLAVALLIGHFSVLLAFGLFKWCESDGGVYQVLLRGFKRPFRPAGFTAVTADCGSMTFILEFLNLPLFLKM